MYMYLSYKKKFPLLLALLTVIFSPVQIDSFDNNAAKFTVGAIGAVAGAVGLYSLYDWAFSENDEAVIARSYANMQECRQSYEQEWHLIGTQVSAAWLHEDILYALARLKHHKDAITSYTCLADTRLQRLESCHAELLKRINQKEKSLLHNQLLKVADDLFGVLEYMKSFVQVLKMHQSYFELYEIESLLGRTYHQELSLLDTYAHDRSAQAWAIRNFVITQSKTSSLPFPRVLYCHTLTHDINRLESIFNRATRHYAERMGFVRQLIDTLKAIKSYVVTDVLYTQESLQYEHDKREKERIAIERSKAQAEQRKAEAEERRAATERERLWLEEQQLREKKKENYLKEKELNQKEREIKRQQRYNY